MNSLNQRSERLSKHGLASLRALHDCRVIRARWNIGGYEELTLAHLVERQSQAAGSYDYRLNDTGKQIAARKFGPAL